MRMLGGLVATTLCALAAATPAHALGDLQNCDAIKDAGQRMACLQAHIAHLEQTLLSLSSDLVDLQHELKEKVSVNAVYRLQYVAKSACLGYGDKDKPPIFVSCDHPDSWKLLRGSQSPARGSSAPKSSDTSADQPSNKSSDQSPDKGSGKSKDKSSGKSNDQPKAAGEQN